MYLAGFLLSWHFVRNIFACKTWVSSICSALASLELISNVTILLEVFNITLVLSVSK